MQKHDILLAEEAVARAKPYKTAGIFVLSDNPCGRIYMAITVDDADETTHVVSFTRGQLEQLCGTTQMLLDGIPR